MANKNKHAPEVLDKISFTEFTSRSHHSWLPLCIHTVLCNEVAAVARQRAIIAIYIPLFCIIIRLLPLRSRLNMKNRIRWRPWPPISLSTSTHTECCMWCHVVLLHMRVTACPWPILVGVNILKESMNSYIIFGPEHPFPSKIKCLTHKENHL